MLVDDLMRWIIVDFLRAFSTKKFIFLIKVYEPIKCVDLFDCFYFKKHSIFKKQLSTHFSRFLKKVPTHCATNVNFAGSVATTKYLALSLCKLLTGELIILAFPACFGSKLDALGCEKKEGVRFIPFFAAANACSWNVDNEKVCSCLIHCLYFLLAYEQRTLESQVVVRQLKIYNLLWKN